MIRDALQTVESLACSTSLRRQPPKPRVPPPRAGHRKPGSAGRRTARHSPDVWRRSPAGRAAWPSPRPGRRQGWRQRSERTLRHSPSRSETACRCPASFRSPILTLRAKTALASAYISQAPTEYPRSYRDLSRAVCTAEAKLGGTSRSLRYFSRADSNLSGMVMLARLIPVVDIRWCTQEYSRDAAGDSARAILYYTLHKNA